MRILLVVMLLLAGGCRKSSEKTTVHFPEGTVTTDGDKVTARTDKNQATIDASDGKTVVQTTEGGKKATYTAGDKKVPEGFPLPVMSGATIDHSAHITQDGSPEVYQLSLKTASPPEQIAEFYEKAFKDRGLTVGRSDTKGDEILQCVVAGRSEKVEASVTVVKNVKAKEATASIYWSLEK